MNENNEFNASKTKLNSFEVTKKKKKIILYIINFINLDIL